MVSVALTEKEVELVKKSINHCLNTCKEGGAKDGCQDCQALEGVLGKISEY